MRHVSLEDALKLVHRVQVYEVIDDTLSPDFPLGDALEVYVRREDAERFLEEVRGDEPEGSLRIFGSRSASSRRAGGLQRRSRPGQVGLIRRMRPESSRSQTHPKPTESRTGLPPTGRRATTLPVCGLTRSMTFESR